MLGVDRLASTARSEPFTTTRRRLVGITALLGILTVGHDVDHVRQGRGLPFVLYLVAVGALVSIATTLIVLVRYRAWSRPVAMAQGITTVVGVGVVHVAPEWSKLADSYAAAGADTLSWLIILAMMLAGLALTIVAANQSLNRPSARCGWWDRRVEALDIE